MLCSNDPQNQKGLKREDIKRYMDKGNRRDFLGRGVLVKSETDGPSWLDGKAVLGKNLFEGIFNVERHGERKVVDCARGLDSAPTTVPAK